MVETSPSNAGGAGSIPGWGAKIPRASRPKNENIKQKQYCNKFNKDFKNGLHQKNLKKKKTRMIRCESLRPSGVSELQNCVVFVFMIEGSVYLGQKIYMMVTSTSFRVSALV